MTDIVNNPETWKSDGRMYPPQLDSLRPVQGRPDVTRFRTLGHYVDIAQNGAIVIARVGGPAVFVKGGADGKGVY